MIIMYGKIIIMYCEDLLFAQVHGTLFLSESICLNQGAFAQISFHLKNEKSGGGMCIEGVLMYSNCAMIRNIRDQIEKRRDSKKILTKSNVCFIVNTTGTDVRMKRSRLWREKRN